MKKQRGLCEREKRLGDDVMGDDTHQKFKKLIELHGVFHEELKRVYYKGIKNTGYKEKLNNKVDTIMLDTDKHYKYQKERDETIKINIKTIIKEGEYDKQKINKLLDIRVHMLQMQMYKLKIDHIGTLLNRLREYYQDIYNDFIRSLIKK